MQDGRVASSENESADPIEILFHAEAEEEFRRASQLHGLISDISAEMKMGLSVTATGGSTEEVGLLVKGLVDVVRHDNEVRGRPKLSADRLGPSTTLATTRPTLIKLYKRFEGTGIVSAQSTTMYPQATDELRADIDAFGPSGYGVTLTGLGAPVHAAPASGDPTNWIDVSANVSSFETASVICPPGAAYSRSYAHLRLGIIEFDPNYQLMGQYFGPETIVYDHEAIGFGINIRIGEQHIYGLSTRFLVQPGNIYEVWLFSRQFATCFGGWYAGSAFIFDFSGISWSFGSSPIN